MPSFNLVTSRSGRNSVGVISFRLSLCLVQKVRSVGCSGLTRWSRSASLGGAQYINFRVTGSPDSLTTSKRFTQMYRPSRLGTGPTLGAGSALGPLSLRRIEMGPSTAQYEVRPAFNLTSIKSPFLTRIFFE